MCPLSQLCYMGVKDSIQSASTLNRLFYEM